MNGVHILDGMPQTIAQGAEEGASKITEAVELAGARVAKSVGQAAKGAGKAGGSRISSRIVELLMTAPAAIRGKGVMRPARAQLPSSEAKLRARLDKTSRELAHESSDLSAAVESLNKVIRANRRAAKRGRTRLLMGTAAGAALMYHFDAEHGRERRAATARLLTSMVRGQTPPGSGSH